MTGSHLDALETRQRRRLVARSVARSSLSVGLLILLYYLAPLTGGLGLTVGVILGLGLLAFGVTVAWQIRAIARAAYPRLRAIESLAICVPLLLVLFSVSYVLMAQREAGSFSLPLDRTGALYFTVSVFATVGFGDVVPLGTAARVLVIVQMALDLVVVGVVGRLMLGAVRVRLGRQQVPGVDGTEDHPPRSR